MADSLHASLVGNKYISVKKIQKTRRLPMPGEILVKPGDKVEPETIVAKISLKPGIPWVIPVARQLGVEPYRLENCMLVKVGDKVEQGQPIGRADETGIYGRKVYEAPIGGIVEEISFRSGRVVIREEFGKEEPPVSFDACFELRCRPNELRQYMLRNVGDEVKRGQIIAKKGTGHAYSTNTARAPISGKITEINEHTGYVTIARPFEEVVVKGYITGTVADILPERGCVVETPAVVVNGIFGVGGETHGELVVAVPSHDAILEEHHITEDMEGKIIVGGSFATDEALARAMQIGVKGVITGTASYLNLVRSLGCKLGVGITGTEDIDMTVILMEGFGHLNMREEIFEIFKAVEGYHVSINGATQIRAGAIRPEIIVPLPDWDQALESEPVIDEELVVGEVVRCINKPYFGEIGTVINVPREPVVIETECKAPVVEVELRDGRKVIVPRQNVEVL
ncbi:MAG: hypothetical protein GX060_01500 [Firmicutes bacterium]|nr:hypothetical protein [Bacillota bacterium]